MDISRRGFLATSIAAAGFAPTDAEKQGGATRAAAEATTRGALPVLSLTETAALLRSRRLSPVELTQAVLDRIDRIDGKVGAFIAVTRDRAIAAARAAENEIAAGKYRGPLHGIPVGVKDTHYTKGIPTTANTPVLLDFVPAFDATVVTRLTRAGAVLIGKRSCRSSPSEARAWAAHFRMPTIHGICRVRREDRAADRPPRWLPAC